jgi:hypothetical protein
MIATYDRDRRGYSLTVVLIFVILLFALWSTVYRTTSSLLRVETNRSLQQSRDQGAMNALAQALQLLQYSTPYDTNIPDRATFIYGVEINVGECVSTHYTIQFTAAPTDSDSNRWQIQITPGSSPSSVPLPNPGPSPQWAP